MPSPEELAAAQRAQEGTLYARPLESGDQVPQLLEALRAGKLDPQLLMALLALLARVAVPERLGSSPIEEAFRGASPPPY